MPRSCLGVFLRCDVRDADGMGKGEGLGLGLVGYLS